MLYFESQNVLKLYNLEARLLVDLMVFTDKPIVTKNKIPYPHIRFGDKYDSYIFVDTKFDI